MMFELGSNYDFADSRKQSDNATSSSQYLLMFISVSIMSRRFTFCILTAPLAARFIYITFKPQDKILIDGGTQAKTILLNVSFISLFRCVQQGWKHLYKPVCPSVCLSFCRSVRLSVGRSPSNVFIYNSYILLKWKLGNK